MIWSLRQVFHHSAIIKKKKPKNGEVIRLGLLPIVREKVVSPEAQTRTNEAKIAVVYK